MKKLLAANRSEIAVRLFRSATELGMKTVAIFAHEDRFGVHRFKADESYLVGRGKGPVAAYLDIENIITLAKEKEVDFIHPGYGFLSENPEFARACIENGITWVGPRPEMLEKMGDKVAALARSERDTGLDLEALDEFSICWEAVRQYYQPFDSGPEVVRTYHEVNFLLDDMLWEHLMYPDVHAGFFKHLRDYDNVSVLPTTAFFYGLDIGEEISVEIEEGKTLIIKLITVGEPDKDGFRSVTFELNGRARETKILDTSIQAEAAPRRKADPADPKQIGAPIPGVVSSINVSVGHKVEKGEKLATLEAMKMQTSLYAHAHGTVEEICVHVGESVDSKDLILRLG